MASCSLITARGTGLAPTRLGFNDYADGLKVNNSLLTVVLHD